jgi:hypothetical protein
MTSFPDQGIGRVVESLPESSRVSVRVNLKALKNATF